MGKDLQRHGTQYSAADFPEKCAGDLRHPGSLCLLGLAAIRPALEFPDGICLVSILAGGSNGFSPDRSDKGSHTSADYGVRCRIG